MKEVRFNEQVTKEPTYLLKNVLGGTILLEIAFSEPYFSVKVRQDTLETMIFEILYEQILFPCALRPFTLRL